jgi:hypothetical protein
LDASDISRALVLVNVEFYTCSLGLGAFPARSIVRSSRILPTQILSIRFPGPYPCVSALTTRSVFFSLIVRGFRSSGEHLTSQLDLGCMPYRLVQHLDFTEQGVKVLGGSYSHCTRRHYLTWPQRTSQSAVQQDRYRHAAFELYIPSTSH